jgi:hypothetical protein
MIEVKSKKEIVFLIAMGGQQDKHIYRIDGFHLSSLTVYLERVHFVGNRFNRTQDCLSIDLMVLIKAFIVQLISTLDIRGEKENE